MRTRVLFALIGFSLNAAAAEAPKFQSLDQYTRIQIPASPSSSFRLVNGSGTEAVVVVDRVKPGTLDNLSSWTDGRVKAVSASQLGLDKVELKVSFQQGGTESFAYLQGGTLVVDLWKQTSSAAEKPAAKLAQALPAKVKAAPARKIASVAAAKAEPKAASVAPLNRQDDIFQRFVLPMPELRIDAKGEGFSLPPKGEISDLWSFPKGEAKKEGSKSYDFAKQLFEEKKYGLAIKTVEIIRRDEPKSAYLDQLAFLEALCYRRLGEAAHNEALSAKAEKMFEELGNRRDEKGNPLPFHAAIRLYFAQVEFNKGNWLQAISHLEYVNGAYPKGDAKLPFIQIMLAESYVKVNQPRRAERLYRYLSEHYPRHVLGKEARYRIADLLALERNYNRVTEEGQEAINTYPDYEKTRSEVLFQMGEANFWLNKLAASEKYFRRFTEISSAQTNSALAWVRIGEIQEVAKGDLKAARESYMKAKNGYPFSQGDLVATVRLARIDLPNEKEPAFIVKSLTEMLADKSIDGDLKRMAELTLGDYLLLTGEVDRAIDLARDGLAQTEGTTYEAFKGDYMNALFAKLQGLNKEKKYAEALALYDRERKWFDQHGAESYRAVADTYRGLGLYATSNELMEKYARGARGGRGLASRAREEALSLAKAKNSFARGAYAETLSHLSVEEEDAEVLAMRAVSEFRLGRKREAYRSAEKALNEAAKDKLADATLADLAEILIDRGMTDRDFARMESDVAGVRKLMEKGDERLAFAYGDSLWYQKKHKEAVKAYQAALEGFPKAGNERAERARYNMGMSLISLGSHEEAVKQLTQLRDSGQSVWAESAKQELELMNWEKKYSSVLRTLPPSGLGITN
jgi:TolA-binding protein